MVALKDQTWAAHKFGCVQSMPLQAQGAPTTSLHGLKTETCLFHHLDMHPISLSSLIFELHVWFDHSFIKHP